MIVYASGLADLFMSGEKCWIYWFDWFQEWIWQFWVESDLLNLKILYINFIDLIQLKVLTRSKKELFPLQFEKHDVHSKLL